MQLTDAHALGKGQFAIFCSSFFQRLGPSFLLRVIYLRNTTTIIKDPIQTNPRHNEYRTKRIIRQSWCLLRLGFVICYINYGYALSCLVLICLGPVTTPPGMKNRDGVNE